MQAACYLWRKTRRTPCCVCLMSGQVVLCIGFACLLILLVSYCASCVAWSRSHMEGLPHASRPGRLPGRGRVPGLERRVAAQRQTGARCPTPRAQPRCNSLKQRRPDGLTQTRDPTKSPDTNARRDPKGCPTPCPVASTTSGGATSATPARIPCERPNALFVGRRRLELGSGPSRTGGTSSSI